MLMAAGAVQPLKQVLGPSFYVGCAISADMWQHPEGAAGKVVLEHFNSVVPCNELKPESVQPREGEWHWEDADAYVAFAEAHGMFTIGHCLVWHSQTPAWFFQGEDGQPASKEQLIARLRTHIHTVVGRYKGRIQGWDVANECFTDDGAYRQSPWYQIIGEDYLALAFQFAHEADPEAELYYNDYSLAHPAKREAVCRLVRDLQRRGLRIDAVGMQSHNGLDWPSLAEYEASIKAFAGTGVKVNISELDLNVLPTPEGFHGAEVSQHFEGSRDMDPYAQGVDSHTADLIAERWQALFLVYRTHANVIERVTFWAVGDADSWLNDWPIRGRHAVASLFDREYQPKSVIEKIYLLYE